MPSPQDGRPRERSSFAAAFLSLLFPGLGHAYAGAWNRALGFAAVPILVLALAAGIVLRVDALQLLGFLLQPEVLIAILVLDVIVLLYRVIATVDAWRVANFLNLVEGGGGSRRSGSSFGFRSLSLAGLLAVLLVLSGVHVAVAYVDINLLQFDRCVFGQSASGCQPGDNASPAPSSSDAGPTNPPNVNGSFNAGSANPNVTAPPAASSTTTPGGRLNILLLGVDQRPKEDAFNTDTMIVVSIDPATHQAAMFSLPRDTVDVPLPPGPAQRVFGSTFKGKINSLWKAAQDRPDVFPGNNNSRGFNALKQALGYLYGLPISYYVEVNFDGFKKVVDTLGGVTINVQIPVMDDRYPGDDGRLQRVYIPSGIQHMTGAEALVYARSRHASTDFDRAQRQQRVLLSLREQADIGSLVARFSDLVGALGSAVHTDIPTGQLQRLLPLADQIDTNAVRSYVFSPPLYGTEYSNDPAGLGRGYVIVPDVAKIRSAVSSAFSTDPKIEALREKVAEENATVWVLNGTGQNNQAGDIAGYLEYLGVSASSPNQRPDVRGLTGTRIVVYNGAETRLTSTIKLLQQLFKVKVTTATDRSVRVDVVITTSTETPPLTPPPAP